MICNTLADQGKRVIVAGLDQDYLGKPFEPMPQLLAIAEYITKTLAICMVCGNPANHTQRLVASGDRVLARRAGHLRGAVPRAASIRCSPASRRATPASQVAESLSRSPTVASPQPRRIRPANVESIDPALGLKPTDG